jgi:dinuclear metal center YbgI/SA1388 family protein
MLSLWTTRRRRAGEASVSTIALVADRDEILAYARDFLELDSFSDYGPMGMQVAGSRQVRRIACGVSASLELFQRAAAEDAQLLLVHHGLLWDKESRVIDETMRARLAELFAGEITLAAYHLALDANPDVGNNALLSRELGVRPRSRFDDIGFGGELDEPLTIDGLAARLRDRLGQDPLVFAEGPERIRRVAIVTGDAAPRVTKAAAEGYDAFVTGEAAEPTLHTARELGIHFLAGGHYATERLGVQALAAHLAERFGIDWSFVDLPNPV